MSRKNLLGLACLGPDFVLSGKCADCSASNGHNFRLIFELWTWQTEANAFEFGWIASGKDRVAWLQVWFNMTSPRQA